MHRRIVNKLRKVSREEQEVRQFADRWIEHTKKGATAEQANQFITELRHLLNAQDKRKHTT